MVCMESMDGVVRGRPSVRVVKSSVEQSDHLNCDATVGKDTSELGSKEVCLNGAGD